MHELSLAESALEIVEDHARRAGASQVRQVWMEVGALAGVEPESMRFCFDAVTRGTVAEGALLTLLEVPARAWCAACASEVAVAERFSACPLCGGWQLELRSGTELRVSEIEVD